MEDSKQEFINLLHEHIRIMKFESDRMREEAIKDNNRYNSFDQKLYEDAMHREIHEKKYLRLWFAYYLELDLYYLRNGQIPRVALHFFWDYVAPKLQIRNPLTSEQYVFKLVIERLKLNEMFEEKLLLEYFLSEADVPSYFALLLSRRVYNLVDDELKKYLFENDPRSI